MVTPVSCKLKANYPYLLDFMRSHANQYEDLEVRLIGVDKPRITFFRTQRARDAALIDPTELTPAQLMERLKKGPDYVPYPNDRGEVVYLTNKTTTDDLMNILNEKGVRRGFPNPFHFPDLYADRSQTK